MFINKPSSSDPSSAISTVLDSKTFYIHQGLAFSHSGKTTLANGASYYHLFRTPSNISPHVWQILIQSDATPFDVYILEGTAVGANGTAQTPINMNRNSSTVSQVSVYNGPTVTNDGTIIDYFLIAGSKQSGGIGEGNEIELIWKPSTNYAVKVTNNGTGIANFGLYAGWIEIAN